MLPPVEGPFYSFEDGSAMNAAILLVVDESVEAARARGRAWIATKGRSAAWLDHPSVQITEYALDVPAAITLAEF